MRQPGKQDVIEEFLPRFGSGAEVLYVGDASNRRLYLEESRLEELGFFELSHEVLPDVVAYASDRNWLYLIEAVHSERPFSPESKYQIEAAAANCTADLLFVTAFATRAAFRSFVPDIAWETEVWISNDPDHLIHFNGEKFIGPYAAG